MKSTSSKLFHLQSNYLPAYILEQFARILNYCPNTGSINYGITVLCFTKMRLLFRRNSHTLYLQTKTIE